MTQAGLRQRDKRISQLLCLQDKECIENSIPTVDADVEASSSIGDPKKAVVHSVRSLMWCWDEAEQKLKRFRHRNSGRKENSGKMSQQTMVQSGSAGNFTKSMGSDEIFMDRDKIIFRTLRLKSI